MHIILYYIMIKALKSKFGNTPLDMNIDQAVAMIFSTNSTNELSLLFLQRIFKDNDRFSGNLCFPGGFKEGSESLKETAIRQTFEETTIDLNKAEYLGMIDRRLFTMETLDKKSQEKKRMLMGVMLFYLPEIPKIKLNASEVRDYKWVPLKIFFGEDPKVSRFKEMDLPPIFMTSYKLPKCIKVAKFPTFDVGMESVLWGITLICMIYFLEQVMKLQFEEWDMKLDHGYVQKQLKHFNWIKVTLVNGNTFDYPLVSLTNNQIEHKVPTKPKL